MYCKKRVIGNVIYCAIVLTAKYCLQNSEGTLCPCMLYWDIQEV